MSSLLNKITFIVAFVFFIFLIESSTGSPFENDKLAQLIERLDTMQTKMDAIRSRVEILEDENDKWTRKFSDLEAENEKLKTAKLHQDEQLQHLKSQIISHPEFSSISAAKRNDGQSSRVLTSPPTSCQEVKNQNGKVWPIDGIHLLKINHTIQAAFCTFGDDVSESLIGQVDVKTKTVHFYVQRESEFYKSHGVIPFDLAQLNEGNAFNLESGVFTAPVPGIYHFDFSAVKSALANSLQVYLQVNGDSVGATYTWKSAAGSWDVVSMSASLRLAGGDRVNLYNPATDGIIFDGVGDKYSTRHFTHFSGWLVEEDSM